MFWDRFLYISLCRVLALWTYNFYQIWKSFLQLLLKCLSLSVTWKWNVTGWMDAATLWECTGLSRGFRHFSVQRDNCSCLSWWSHSFLLHCQSVCLCGFVLELIAVLPLTFPVWFCFLQAWLQSSTVFLNMHDVLVKVYLLALPSAILGPPSVVWLLYFYRCCVLTALPTCQFFLRFYFYFMCMHVYLHICLCPTCMFLHIGFSSVFK